MRRLLVLLVINIILASSAWSFDGKRKGFVLGGGLGFSPAVHWSFAEFEETKRGFPVQFVIGYGWDSFNAIVYEFQIANINSDLVSRVGCVRSDYVGQGFEGISWYHYIGRTGRSLFTQFGVGRYCFIVDRARNNFRLGAQVGTGYEFMRHLQVGAYFSVGRTESSGFRFHHYQVSLLMSGWAF